MRPIAIAVVEWNNQFLVGQRPLGVVLAGYWEFPGGKLEPGEDPASAAVREVCEETGLKTRALQTLAVVQHTYEHGALELHFIACSVVGEPTALKPPFRWVSPPQLADLAFPPANQRLVSQLVAAAKP